MQLVDAHVAQRPRSPEPGSAVSIGVEGRLRDRLPRMARGHSLAIGMFATRCCGSNVLVGDMTVRFVDAPSPDVVALSPIGGVAVFADRRLVDLLATAGPSLVEVGLPFVRHLAIELALPAVWLDFMASPAACRRPA